MSETLLFASQAITRSDMKASGWCGTPARVGLHMVVSLPGVPHLWGEEGLDRSWSISTGRGEPNRRADVAGPASYSTAGERQNSRMVYQESATFVPAMSRTWSTRVRMGS